MAQAIGKGTLLKGGALLAGSQVAGQVLRFARNVVLARVLSPSDFGVAATFWITTSFLEMISELGIQQKLIQSRNGDDDTVGAVAQSLFLFRGILNGAVLFVLAAPIAHLFDAAHATWGFRLLALIPLMGAFRHQDLERMKRQLRFGPAIISSLLPDVISTIVAIPIALAVRDYRAFLYVALLNTALGVLLSHMVAEHSFRLAWDRQIVRQFTSFGWPLMINSVLIYGMLQGDRMILALAYGPSELGLYSVALGLVISVGGLAGGVVNPMAFPLLARVQDDRPSFLRAFQLYVRISALISALLAVGAILLGPWLILLLYGHRYAAAGAVVGWLGVLHGLRGVRGVGAMAAMALGDTRNTLVANTFRYVGMGGVLVVAWFGMSMEWIVIAGIGGELAALSISPTMLRRRHQVPLRICWQPAGVFAALVAVALLLRWIGLAHIGTPYAVIASGLFVAGVPLVSLQAFPDLRERAARLAGNGISQIPWMGQSSGITRQPQDG